MSDSNMTCPPMPPRPLKFGGRDDELAAAIMSITGKRRVAITALHGMGGLGKTTLAFELAHQMCEAHLFDVVVATTVGPDRDVRSVLEEWARYGDSTYMADYTQPPNPQIAKAKLTEALKEKCGCDPRNVLILIDDVWSLETANILRSAAPDQAAILMTTRKIVIARELDDNALRLDTLAADKAVLFLREYLSKAEETALHDLGQALHGHPLALKIAATRARNALGLAGAKIDSVLAKHTEEYRKGMRAEAGDDKDSSLKVSLDFSYNDLKLADQKRFRALGILAKADFKIALLAALWELALDEVEEKGCLPLVNVSLLEADTEQAGIYRLHMLVHEYAAEKMREAGEEESALFHYAAHMTIVGTAFQRLPLEEWGQLDADLPHIDEVGNRLTDTYLEAGDHASEELAQRVGDFVLVVMLYVYYRPVLIDTKSGKEWRSLHWLSIALEASRLLKEQRGETAILTNIGKVWFDLGDKYKALAYYDQALLQHRELGDKTGEAATLHNMGRVWHDLDDKHKALDYYNQALLLHHEVDDKRGEATTLNNIGGVWSELENKDKALGFYDQALALRREVGDKDGEATTLNNIGLVWYDRGDKHKALAFYDQAMPLIRAVGNKRLEAVTSFNIGLAYRLLGSVDLAIQHIEHSVFLSEQLQDPDLERERQTLEKLKRQRDGHLLQPSPQDPITKMMRLYLSQGEKALTKFLRQEGGSAAEINLLIKDIKRHIRKRS